MEKEKKRGGLLGIVVIVLLVVFIAGGAGAYMTGAIGGAKDGQITTITESTLKEVVEISELSTVEYTYNAVALSYLDEEKTKPKYHVAYEGRVKAGINFKDIGISVDEEQKTIKISIPEVKILDCSVNEGTLEYIFEKDKYNDLTVSSEHIRSAKKTWKRKLIKKENFLS